MAEDDIPALEQDKDGGKPDDPPRDEKGKFIPKVRLDEVLAEARSAKEALAQEREARIRLEEQVKAMQAAAKTPTQPQKVYTRAELNQMVEEGKISREQAEDYLDQVRELRLREAISKELAERDAQRERVARVKTELQRYKELVPEVMKAGTEEREQVTQEFNYLVSLGQPNDATTELAALRAVFGPVEKLERKKQMRGERERFQESGGRRDDGGGAPKGKEPDLPSRYREHYQRLIDRGIYKGWDDEQLQKELKRIPAEELNRRAKKFG